MKRAKQPTDDYVAENTAQNSIDSMSTLVNLLVTLSNTRPEWRRYVVICVASLLSGLSATADRCAGQSLWHVTPYDLRVVLALEDAPELGPVVGQRMQEDLVARCEASFASACNVEVRQAGPLFRAVAVQALGEMTEDGLLRHDAEWGQLDKLIVAAVGVSAAGFDVKVREMDCRTRMWGPVHTRRLRQGELLGEAVFQSVVAAFSPVALIGGVDQDQAVLQVRAGALIMRDESPARISDGDVLMPVVRRNDRLGNPLIGGIQPVPWTYLTVTAQQQADVLCDVHTGIRNALGGSSSRRTDRLAIVVRPSLSVTRLRLRSRVDGEVPLVGYDVIAKDPQTETSQPVGRSDFRGNVDVPVGENPLALLYIKHGGELLARLPIVPGFRAEQMARITDDDQRLEVEGRIRGLQHQLVDLVTRRKLLAVRVRGKIGAKQLDDAELLLTDLRSMQNQTQLSLALDQQQQEMVSSDARVQAKINDLYTQTRQLLNQYLDADDLDALTLELANARAEG